MKRLFKNQLWLVGTSLAFLGIATVSQSKVAAEEVEWIARTTQEVREEVVTNEQGVQEYTVKWGDTLSVIAEAMDVSLDALVRMNEIQNASLIYAGTEITYSADEQTVAIKNKEEETVYQLGEAEAGAVVETVEKPIVSSQAQEPVYESNSTSGYTLTVEATAYSYAEAGLSAYAADGTNLIQDPNVIAVDPSVIPLGSWVEIPGYGIYRAADTGGAIVGNRIDVHFTSVAQTNQFGRRTLTIRVLR